MGGDIVGSFEAVPSPGPSKGVITSSWIENTSGAAVESQLVQMA